MNNLFGTDGIRCRFGSGVLKHHELHVLGKAIAQWMAHRSFNPIILIIHDTRQSAAFVKSALKTGLLLSQVTVIDGGVLPTPAAWYLLHADGPWLYDCALIISASHNPHYDNGIKILVRSGKLTIEDELYISHMAMQLMQQVDVYDSVGTDVHYHDEAGKHYAERIVQQCAPRLLSNKKIILDVAYGATYICAPSIFRACGAQVITVNDQPNGKNINASCGSLYPESLQAAVLAHQADAGFAFDGDGDRVIAVARDGKIKDGDDLLALLLMHPDYKQESAVVGTTMTNGGFEHFLKTQGKSLRRVAVGDKNVAECLQQESLRLGGEQSGHIILNDIAGTGDGIMVALKVLESMILTNNDDMHTFVRFPQVLVNVPVTKKFDLSQEPFAQIIARTQQLINPGRVLVRFSGTEPLLRIMIEAASQEQARYEAQGLAHKLQELLYISKEFA